MKKLVFFIPLLVFALLYEFLALDGIGAISPIVIGWLALYAIAGVLLSKKICWGAVPGMLPAVHLIYMSTQGSGQVVNIELPLGVVVLVFYLACGYLAYKGHSNKQK